MREKTGLRLLYSVLTAGMLLGFVLIAKKHNTSESICTKEDSEVFFCADENERMQVSPNDNVHYVIDQIDCTLAHILIEKENVTIEGNGFVLYKDENRVVICTNHHIINQAEEAKIKVVFPGGEKCESTILEIGNASEDVSLLQVESNSLSDACKDRIRAIYLPEGYTDSLDVCFKTTDDQGDIKKTVTGEILSTEENPDVQGFESLSLMEISGEILPGDSGAPVFDGYGNLIGMTRAHSINNQKTERNWCVPLYIIRKYYKESVD